MKIRMLFFALCAVGSVSAADASRILLKGTSISVEDARAFGGAQAVVGDVSVTAEAITFDKEENVLRCVGAVTVRIAVGLVRTKDCVIELEAGEKRLFFLSQGEIRTSPKLDPISTSVAPPLK